LEFWVVWTLDPGPVAAAIVKATLPLLSTARVPWYSPLPVAPPKSYVSAAAPEQQNNMDNRKIPAAIVRFLIIVPPINKIFSLKL
jgi:hypothetical protein